MTETVYTLWPPREENEPEVLAVLRRMAPAAGAAETLAYVYRIYLDEARHSFTAAEGNVIMAKLFLVCDKFDKFLEFRNIALECDDVTQEQLQELGDMAQAWSEIVWRTRRAPAWWRTRSLRRGLCLKCWLKV